MTAPRQPPAQGLHGRLTVVALLALVLTASAAWPAELEVRSTSGIPGQQARFGVVIHTEGDLIASVQNEIVFDSFVSVVGDMGQRPVCSVNPAIEKQSTVFAFLPPGCGPGLNCERVKAIVLDVGNLDPILDGSMLYSCMAKVSLRAEVGARYPITCANAHVSDPSGMAIDLRCADGEVLVIEAAPTLTPTPVWTPEVSIEISYAASTPGEEVEVAIVLHSHGHEVTGVQNDIIFDPALVDMERAGSCKINPAISDRLAECDEDPPAAACKSLRHNLAECPAAAGCPDGSEGLKRFRGIVLSTSNVNTIPDGELYRCTFTVAADADLTLGAPLLCVNAGTSDPGGNALRTSCRDGEILAPGGTPRPTRTPTRAPPAATSRPTYTRGPTRTPTQARTPTATWDPRLPTWTPAPTTTRRPPGEITTIYIETDKLAVSSGLGGTVTVRAFAFDENNQPLNGVDLLFDFAPKVGKLRPISTTTRSKELAPGGCTPTEIVPGGCENPQPNTCRQPGWETCEAGVAEVAIEIEPWTASPGTVRVTALAAGSVGEVEFLVVSGESAGPVAAVVLRTATSTCGTDSGGSVGLRAFVFDAYRNPLNDVNMLFLSPIGDVIPLTAKTTDEFGEPGGEARSTINLWPGTPVLRDDNGNIMPYLITARAGGVEGVAQLFVVPGRVCEGYQGSGYVGEPAFAQLGVSPTTLGVRGSGLPDAATVTATVFDNSGNRLNDREIRFSLGAGGAWGAALSLRHCSGALDTRCEIDEHCLRTGSCIEESGSRVSTLTDRAGKTSVRLLAGPVPGVVTINVEVPSLLGDEFTEPCAHAATDSQRCVAANAVYVWVYAPAPPIPAAGHSDDDGCQIARGRETGTPWFLLLPALVLLRRERGTKALSSLNAPAGGSSHPGRVPRRLGCFRVTGRSGSHPHRPICVVDAVPIDGADTLPTP